jgi:hypothetical protein
MHPRFAVSIDNLRDGLPAFLTGIVARSDAAYTRHPGQRLGVILRQPCGSSSSVARREIRACTLPSMTASPGPEQISAFSKLWWLRPVW